MRLLFLGGFLALLLSGCPAERDRGDDDAADDDDGVSCEAPLIDCGGTCVDPRSDKEHCGGCGIDCGTLQDCCDGECSWLTENGNCGECGRTCDEGQDCCDGECSNMDTDDHCGECGNACGQAGPCPEACDVDECKTTACCTLDCELLSGLGTSEIRLICPEVTYVVDMQYDSVGVPEGLNCDVDYAWDCVTDVQCTYAGHLYFDCWWSTSDVCGAPLTWVECGSQFASNCEVGL